MKPTATEILFSGNESCSFPESRSTCDESSKSAFINNDVDKSSGIFGWSAFGNKPETGGGQFPHRDSTSNDIVGRGIHQDTSNSNSSSGSNKLSCLGQMLHSKNHWLGNAWSAGEEMTAGADCKDKGGTVKSNGITQDVHRKLQDQLARKQQEVQDIQHKIAKNKKWGDFKKGQPDRYRNPPHARFPPEPINPFSLLNRDYKKKRTDSFRMGEVESTLDPNSPCFYPSQNIWSNPPGGAYQEVGGQPMNSPNFGNFIHRLGTSPKEYSQNQKNFNPLVPNNHSRFSLTQNHPNVSFPSNPPAASFQKFGERNAFETGYFDKRGVGRIGAPFHPMGSHGQTRPRFPNVPQRPAEYNHPPFPRHLNRNAFIDPHAQPTSNTATTSKNDRLFDKAPGCEVANHSMRQRAINNSGRVVRKASVGKDSSAHQWKPENASSPNCSSCKLRMTWPHIISCFHSFCFSCLAKNVDKTERKLKCPTCSTITELTGGHLADLDIDFLKCKALHAQSLNPFSCMTCSLEKPAVTHCTECLVFICLECKLHHQNDSATSSHEMRDVKKVKKIEGEYVETCEEHPDSALEQYCEECKKLVCNDCTKFGQSHGDHRIGDKAKLYPSAMNKIRLMNSQLDEMRNEVQKRIQPLTLLKQDIETSIRLCKQDVHKYSNFLLAETEKCRSKARVLVDKVYEDFGKDVKIAQSFMVEYMTGGSPFFEFFRRYLLDANPCDLLSVCPLMQAKMTHIEEKYDEINKFRGLLSANVSFEPDYTILNEYLQNQYNKIQITENLSDALPSDTTELGRRIENDIRCALERRSNNSSPQSRSVASGDGSDNPPTCPGLPSSDSSDPQDEMFNYNRIPIGFIHQFGKYGRGEYEFVEPSGVLYLIDGSLAVCDTANHRIVVYDSKYKYVRTIGQPPNLPPLRDQRDYDSRNDRHLSRTHQCLYFPYRIAQCPKTENIVVIERPPSRDIQIFSVLGKFITCFGGDTLQHPRGVAVDENGIIVTVEGRTMKLMLFSQEGKLLHKFFLSVHLEFPNDVAARDGMIFISDNRGHCVHVFDYNADPKHTIGNESVTYYPIGVSLTHLNQVVVTDNHNTFNISVFDASDGRYLFGFKSKVRHANCYNVAVHPSRLELAVTSRENQVVIFNFDPFHGNDGEIEVKTVAYFNNEMMMAS